jgi:5-hydroxyisourate hydrolase
MSQLTTHILDTTKGQPAKLVKVVLYQHVDRAWIKIANGITNSDGRIPNLLSDDAYLPFGIYKLNFDTKHYFDSEKIKSFYPMVEIIFEITTTEHYHVPLLLNPFGYSTYRGS